jgi:predicted dehydrogenase
MSVAPLRIGIIGANPERGWARDAHLPALRALDGFVIQAVSARTQDIADAAKASFGAVSAYADSLALARDPDVDIVSVCVKVPEHRAVVLAALAAGKHVYCEWPLGRDTAEAEEMAAAAKAAGVHVAIGLQGANAIGVRHAGQLVQDGAIGDPQSLNMISPTAGWGRVMPEVYAYLQDRSNGATLLSIAGGHSLAAIEQVVGAFSEITAIGSALVPLVEISGTGKTIERTGFDHLVIVGRHANGCVSTLEVVGGTSSVPFSFALRGSAGILTIAGGHAGGFQVGPLTVSTEPPSAPQAPPIVLGVEGPALNLSAMYARLGDDIRDGTWTVPDFAAAVHFHRLLDAIDTSASEGRCVRLDD